MLGTWGSFQCNVYNSTCSTSTLKTGYKTSYKLSIDCDNTIHSNKGLKQILRIKRTSCTFLLDTDAFVNILDKATYCKIGKNCAINKRHMPFWGHIPLDVMGTCVLDVHWRDISQNDKLVMDHFGILDLLLITVSTCRKPVFSGRYSAKYPDVFCGVWTKQFIFT